MSTTDRHPPDHAEQDDEIGAAPASVTIADRVLEALAVLSLAAITLLLFANATLRFAAGAPIGWTEEIVTGLMLWLTMFGFVLGVRRRESIAVTAFTDRLPARLRAWVALCVEVLGAFVLLHLAWYAYQYVLVFGGDSTPYLRLPQGFFTAALPVGTALAALVIVCQIPGTRAIILRGAEEGRR
ncbi:TRAP transporter small permease [Nocardia sp. BMG51109]|uniref:TRAP transporter small permease n=1 Tax=Nocardia sp. BMG51109 TaxID=1056816 RepID=UPI000467D7C7|nr:TRAP transporter small permease [Nocardia sp. BMG51109]